MLTILAALLCWFAEPGYLIQGTISSSQDSRYIYLYGIDYSGLNSKLVDSCLITNGQFSFTGKLNTPAMLASLYLKDNRVFFQQFFIENKTIHIKAIIADSTNRISRLESTNNPVTQQYYLFRKQQEPFNRVYQLYNTLDSLKHVKANDSIITKVKTEQNALIQQQREAKVAYVKAHPDDYFSLLWLRVDLSQFLETDPLMMESLYSGLATDLRNLPEGKMLREEIQALTAIQVGKLAPSFDLDSPEGVKMRLEKFRGKYLLVDFWASWCGPCIENLPQVKQVYNRFHAKGLEVISISIDDNRQKWLDAIKKHDVKWHNASDLKGWKGKTAMNYNIKYIPKTILLDPTGKIIAVDPDLQKDLPRLLQPMARL